MGLIAQNTIDQTLSRTDIVNVIGQFVDLKKEGSSFKGKSPFTNEKTPSFFVVPAKNFFKDFSSGKSGSVVHFLQELKGWSFPEAIKWLAREVGVEMEFEQETEEQKGNREKAQLYKKLNQAAVNHFVSARMVLPEDHPAQTQLNRFDQESLLEWQIGYTSDDPHYIYNLARQKGHTSDVQSAGLLRQTNGKYRDYFRRRVTFPIHDWNGNVVAFGGRAIQKEENPKYLNSANSPTTWSKDSVLFGMHRAARSIQKKNRVIITEGYTDVISLHEIGLSETVATLGSSNLSQHHINQIKRLCKTVVILRDGDAAGQRSAKTDMEMILKANLRAIICLLPEGKDPFDICHDLEIEDPGQWIDKNITDALLHFSHQIYQDAGEDAYKQSDAIDQIARWLGLIKDDIVREKFQSDISKQLKVKKANLIPKKDESIISHPSKAYKDFNFDFPAGVDENEAIRNGFYGIINGDQTGYYFSNGPHFEKKSNFVMTPVFHKYDPVDNTRIVKLDNGHDKTEIVEMPGDALIKPDKLSQFLWEKGPYLFEGTKLQLLKIINKHLYEFPKGFPLNTLGWQKEGFFAFYNCIYNGKLSNYDEAGLVKHEEHYFFSPGISDIYKDIRDEDDMYENDKYLRYTEAKINFSQWAELMTKVYGQHAWAGVPYVLVSIFRDIVFKVDNNVPFLYCYGQTKSGKSKFAESIMNLFFNEMPAFNLNSGTDFAFAASLQRFRNCPVRFNEFDDKDVRDEWFQQLKGAYDGEGRQRGKGISKRKTETQKVNSTLILVGQYMSTKDDNSMLSRSILRAFRLVKDRPDVQVDVYNELKNLEKDGLSSIVTEILPHRDMIEENYGTVFNELFKKIIHRIRASKRHYEERVVRNYTALAAMVELMRSKVEFPWTVDEYLDWIHNEIIGMSTMISESDILVDFWTTVSMLYDQSIIQHGREFKVEQKNQVRITAPEGGDTHVVFDEPKNILYMRLAEIQKYYAKEKRKEGGNPIDQTSLVSYLKNREYYIGRISGERFGSKVTSAHVFEMDGTGINITPEDFPTMTPNTPTPGEHDESNKERNDDLPF